MNAIAFRAETGVGLPEQRMMILLKERLDKGLPFPTVDEVTPTKIVANRGAARNLYALMEDKGLVARSAHGWSSGYFTEIGAQLAARVYEVRDTIPAKRKMKGAKHWKPEMGMRSVHQQSVREVDGENPFKDGRGIGKLGYEVTKGWLRGAKISYLTLEERRTCPASCALLDKCYGDVMVRAVRWVAGEELEDAIDDQLRRWDRNPQKRLLRLHELGDFYSPEYVAKWSDWLGAYPWLHAFGYTARERGKPIGAEIAKTKALWGRRFAIRGSSSTGQWGATVVGDGKSLPPGAFWCPEQGGLVPNCGACGACWSTKKAVAFKEH